MSPDPAALLTKTQRRRIRERFADQAAGKRRRDQQRIRDRLAAGVEDFGLLVDYPDDQLRLAFDGADETELVETLADAHVVLERVREAHDVDRDRVVARADERADAAAGADDVETLSRLRFETDDDRRERLASDLRARVGPTAWDRRAKLLLRFAALMLLPACLIWAVDTVAGTTLLTDYPEAWVPLLFLGGPAVAGAIAIEFAQTTKYDLLPAARALVTDPEAAVAATRARMARTQSRYRSTAAQALRRSWEKL